MPSSPMQNLLARLRISPRLFAVYATFYLVWGLVMNSIGHTAQIAWFAHWWQVFTCYVVYLVPMSLLVRDKNWIDQYAYGVVILAPLEIVGYRIGSSIAADNNILDMILGERNFTLAMSVFFGIIPPIGNFVASSLYRKIFGEEPK